MKRALALSTVLVSRSAQRGVARVLDARAHIGRPWPTSRLPGTAPLAASPSRTRCGRRLVLAQRVRTACAEPGASRQAGSNPSRRWSWTASGVNPRVLVGLLDMSPTRTALHGRLRVAAVCSGVGVSAAGPAEKGIQSNPIRAPAPAARLPPLQGATTGRRDASAGSPHDDRPLVEYWPALERQGAT